MAGQILKSSLVRSIQDEIKQEILSRDSTVHALQWLLEQIAMVEKTPSIPFLVRRHICLNWILMLEIRELATDDLMKMKHTFNDSLNMLRMLVPKPETSRLGFLYADLFSIFSQVLRRHGDYWMSLWYQGLSTSVARRNSDTDEERSMRNRLGFAIKYLRYGDPRTALENLPAHGDGALPDDLSDLALVIDAKCRRLLMDPSARDLLGKARSTSHNLEIEWEVLCLEACLQNNFGPVQNAIRGPRQSHWLAAYVLEGYLLLHCQSDPLWLKQLSKPTSVGRKSSLNAKIEKGLYKAAVTISKLHDDDYPATYLLTEIGEMCQSIQSINGLAGSICFLAAALRWTTQKGHAEFSNILRSEMGKTIALFKVSSADQFPLGSAVAKELGLTF